MFFSQNVNKSHLYRLKFYKVLLCRKNVTLIRISASMHVGFLMCCFYYGWCIFLWHKVLYSDFY